MIKMPLALLPAALLILVSCGKTQGEKDEPEKLEKVPVVQLMRQNTTIHTNQVANIEAMQNVEIRAQVRGFIERIYFDEGSTINQGQLLFAINDREYRVRVSKAKAMLSNAISNAKSARVERDRVADMVEKKVISKTELAVSQAKLESANAEIDAARAELADAELKLSYTEIRAPFTGLVDNIPLKKGSLVEEGTLLTSISDISRMYAYFNISESQYLDYMNSRGTNKNSQTVSLILSNGQTYPYEGKIETLRGEFDESTGSIAVRAVFDNKDMLLRHGSSGKVRLSQRLDSAILVPQKSAFELQDKLYVYVVGKDSVVHQKSFLSGGRQSVFYVMKQGLNDGARVVYEGIQEMQDGDKIIPVLQQPDTTNG